MDEHAGDFFRPYSKDGRKGNFHKVVTLHDSADIDWETISRIAPSLPKGWYELCQLPAKTRIQFTLDFWLSKLPYHPNLDTALAAFFGSLDDIGVFITQKSHEDPFVPQMVYSLSENRGFFRGDTGAKESDILHLQKLFPDYILPDDYLAFLQIHNGFCKSIDSTGITGTHNMDQRYKEFQELLESLDQISTRSGRAVNPHSLIPFYESFGMPYYQCFWGEWHPENEMGNVYYSAADSTISVPSGKFEGGAEDMAFSTFSDWLIFYLETIEA